MRIPSLRIDAAMLSFAGALGAGCGPSAATTDGETPATTSTTRADTGASADTTAGDTGEPTTTPTTTTPAECVEDVDCSEDCHACIEGMCAYIDDCCLYGGVRDASGWRCTPPPDCVEDQECYCLDTVGCPGDEVCEDYVCVPAGDLTLPACPSGPIDLSNWNLEGTPTSLVLADIDNDGDLDVVATEPAMGRLELAFNDGAGMFLPSNAVPVGDAADIRVAVVDIDPLSAVDLVVARKDPDELAVLFGADGTFMPGFTLPSAHDLDALFVVHGGGSVNDIAAIDATSHETVFWRNDGMGGLEPEQTCSDFAVGLGSAIVDADGDGLGDVVAAPLDNATGVQVSFTGNIPLCHAPETLETTTGVTHTHVGDLDVDGQFDIVATRDASSGNGGGATVWQGTAPGKWLPKQEYMTTTRLQGGTLADFDGDGIVDLISATQQDSLGVLLGDGKGGFTCERTIAVPGATTRPELLAVGDLDGDGRLDVLVGTRDAPVLTVVRSP